MPQPTSHLLWTGGWDSTFRLLQLVWEKEQPVQPHYLIDPERPSLSYELRAMYKIKAAIKAERPFSANLIQPTRFWALADLPANQTITEQYRRMNAHSAIGIQYEWLARLVASSGVSQLELGLQGHENGMTYWQIELYKNILPAYDEGDDIYRLKEQPDPADLLLFKQFRFPILKFTKRDMAKWAVEQQCDHILAMTWFCHRPLRGIPCGLCTPCRIIVNDDMAHRLPFISKIRYHAKQLYSYVRRI